MKNELTKIKNELANFLDTINDWEKRIKEIGWSNLDGTAENSAVKSHAKVLIYKLRKISK